MILLRTKQHSKSQQITFGFRVIQLSPQTLFILFAIHARYANYYNEHVEVVTVLNATLIGSVPIQTVSEIADLLATKLCQKWPC